MGQLFSEVRTWRGPQTALPSPALIADNSARAVVFAAIRLVVPGRPNRARSKQYLGPAVVRREGPRVGRSGIRGGGRGPLAPDESSGLVLCTVGLFPSISH